MTACERDRELAFVFGRRHEDLFYIIGGRRSAYASERRLASIRYSLAVVADGNDTHTRARVHTRLQSKTTLAAIAVAIAAAATVGRSSRKSSGDGGDGGGDGGGDDSERRASASVSNLYLLASLMLH